MSTDARREDAPQEAGWKGGRETEPLGQSGGAHSSVGADALSDLTAWLATGEGYRAIRAAIHQPGDITPQRRVLNPYNGDPTGGFEARLDWETRAVMALIGRKARAAELGCPCVGTADQEDCPHG